MSMGIYIPSCNRAGLVRPLQYLRSAVTDRYKTFVVVPKEQQEVYSRTEQNLATWHNVLPCPKSGIGPTRQWILEDAKARNLDVCLMLDDDIHFATRRKDDQTKFVPTTLSEYPPLMGKLHSMLLTMAHGSVATRQGANRNTATLLTNTRMLRVLGYNVKKYFKNNIRYDRVPVMEDFDVTLQLLRSGESNFVLNEYVQDQTKSNAPGGCSGYRTMLMQEQAANELSALHPGFVTVVKKNGKGGDAWATRTDVIIHWKKARNSHDAKG